MQVELSDSDTIFLPIKPQIELDPQFALHDERVLSLKATH
jgi:hypothetical protein